MQEQITIHCVNNNRPIKVEAGSTLEEIYRQASIEGLGDIAAARVNNVVKGLDFIVYTNKDVEFLDLHSPSGLRTYTRSLFFILGYAIKKLFPDKDFCMEAPVSNGYYCRLDLGRPLEDEDIANIRRCMDEVISKDLPFQRTVCHTEDAIKLFKSKGMESKVRLLGSLQTLYSSYHTLEDYSDYYYGALLPRTGKIHLYDIMRYHDGVLVRVPDGNNPLVLKPLIKQNKMLDIFREHQRWQKIIGLRTIGDLNAASSNGYTSDLINIAEALQEKKICQIAEEIQHRPEVRLVLISGPSSSGKTTFSKRLAIQLMVCGYHPVAFSMDDYFVDRVKTPRDAKGEYDFESIDALNLSRLEHDLQELFAGHEIELPKYNFQTGKSEMSGKKLRLDQRAIIIMEGIHGLNPKLTENISDLLKYKIYVSALTTILLDDHNYIPTTDNRLLRRIVRDYKYRGYSALDTIKRWPSVTAGEQKWIFPYQENADIMFNSALLFELAGLRNQALPLLEMVPENVPEHSEAYRLKKFLQYIQPMQIDDLPPTSLLREFLGGSSFHY